MNRIVLISAIIFILALNACKKSDSVVTLKLSRGSNTTISLNGQTDQIKVTNEGQIFLNNQEIGNCRVGQTVEFTRVDGKLKLVPTK